MPSSLRKPRSYEKRSANADWTAPPEDDRPVTERDLSECVLCGPNKCSHLKTERFCSNRSPWGVCGFALKDRYPVLVTESGGEILLRLDEAKGLSRVTLGASSPDEPVDHGTFINLAPLEEELGRHKLVRSEHVRLAVRNGEYFVEPCDSACEVKLNGRRVREACRLNGFDYLGIGQLFFYFLT